MIDAAGREARGSTPLRILGATGTRAALALRDEASGLQGFLCIQDPSAGPAFGGIRLLPYASEEAALRDAALLCRAMHRKVAAAALPCGGAKTTLLLHPGFHRAKALRFLGRTLEALGGLVHAGPDMGIGPEDLRRLREQTQHVADPEALGDLGMWTARGVLAAIQAACSFVWGREGVRGRDVIVQGLGSVGFPLARLLREAGARVRGVDPSPIAGERARAEGLELVEGSPALETPCDVLAPCARGGILDARAIRALSCRVVAGAANNILADERLAGDLARRGVLFVPDFIANAGAVIRGVRWALHREVDSRPAVEAIGPRVARLLHRARERGCTPWALAVREAEARRAGGGRCPDPDQRR